MLSERCSFSHIDLVYILLNLYAGILFFLVLMLNGIVFLISNSTCSLLVDRKVIDFLTLYPATFM